MLEKNIKEKFTKEIIEILRKERDFLEKIGIVVSDTGYIIDENAGYDRIAGTINQEGVWLTRVGTENTNLVNYVLDIGVKQHLYLDKR